MGVKKTEGLPAVRNRGCGALHQRRSSVQFRPLHGPGSRVKSLGSSLAPRRSDGGVGRVWGAAERRVHGGAGALRGGARGRWR
jgi:hypothetical protein